MFPNMEYVACRFLKLNIGIVIKINALQYQTKIRLLIVLNMTMNRDVQNVTLLIDYQKISVVKKENFWKMVLVNRCLFSGKIV